MSQISPLDLRNALATRAETADRSNQISPRCEPSAWNTAWQRYISWKESVDDLLGRHRPSTGALTGLQKAVTTLERLSPPLQNAWTTPTPAERVHGRTIRAMEASYRTNTNTLPWKAAWGHYTQLATEALQAVTRYQERKINSQQLDAYMQALEQAVQRLEKLAP